MEDCTCHESCFECGPYEVADDCLSCFDGYTLTVFYDDGTGNCTLDELEPVPCHETCFECGTFGTADDCFSCVAGLTLNVTYVDGSGSCISEVVDPPDTVVDPPDTVVDPPDTVPDTSGGGGGGGICFMMYILAGTCVMNRVIALGIAICLVLVANMFSQTAPFY